MLRIIFLFIIALQLYPASAQDNTLRFMFYNVENLFDTINNPEKRDDAFTPKGDYRWDTYKYQTKLRR
ncbi:MAG: endonuclease/exonuclease/phosphatase family protein, partial [Bacteroidales bacterium]|nr:endonuclease/exonuclease/phosphatase family protein [Bacteroidales bacterium]